MKQDYEPGLIRTFQWLIAAVVILQPLLQWSLGRIVGISLPTGPRLFSIGIPLLVLVYGWLPWFQLRLKWLFLPLGLTLFAANTLLAKYISLNWMTSSHALMLAMLLTTPLFLSEGTVRNYVSAIFGKLNVLDRTQAAVIALRYGLVN